MMTRCRSAHLYACLLVATGCSGSSGVVSVDDESLHTTLDVAPAAPSEAEQPEAGPRAATCTDGIDEDCRAPVAENAGFVLCGPGVRVCSHGEWGRCVTHGTSGPLSGWKPDSVGCAPLPCSRDGAIRACVQSLPPTDYTSNCYHGYQTCSGGFWGPCDPS